MNKLILYIVVLLLILGGCDSFHPCFTDNIYYCDKEEVEVIPLKGELVLDDMMGITDIAMVEDYLCLVSPRLDTLLHIYTLQGDSVTSLGVKGNGPNDFINMQLNGQSCIDDNDCCLWVNDVSSAMLKRIDLTKSIEKSTCVVDKRVKTYPMSVNAFYLNDSSVVQEMMTAGNYELFTCVNGKSVSHESLYLTDVQNPFSYYKSTMRLDLSSSMLVAAMNSFNQINFLNLRTGERTTSCWGEPVNMTDLVDKESGLEKWVYYIDIELTENQIYALFMDQSQEDAFEKGKNMEIHVFDKVGHPLKVLELDRYACAFCIDNTGSVLYALVDDSQIYRYRL